MKDKGILITDDYDLSIDVQKDVNGKVLSGLVVGHSLYQNQALILICQPGEVKSKPMVGVGLENIIHDQDFLSVRRIIRMQMEMDGQIVTSVKLGKDQILEIDAKYGS